MPVMVNTHPLALITQRVPELRDWWADYLRSPSYDPTNPRVDLAMFTIHLLAQTQEGQIPHLEDVCQGIEDALANADPDRWDAIGLSIIEDLYTEAPAKGIDLHYIYAHLGPLAKTQWRDVYAYHNNGSEWPDAAA